MSDVRPSRPRVLGVFGASFLPWLWMTGSMLALGWVWTGHVQITPREIKSGGQLAERQSLSCYCYKAACALKVGAVSQRGEAPACYKDKSGS